MRRDRRTFLQRCSQGPVAASVEACHPWRWLGVRGRAVSRLPQRTRPSLAFRTFRLAVHRHRRQLHGLDAPGACRDLWNPVTPPPTLASPSAFSPSRAGPAHLAVRGPASPGTSSLVGWPISRWPRERPLPEDESSFGRRLPHRRSRSALVVSHHLDGFRRSRIPACCSRYRVWVRQVSVGSVVGAEAPRAGSVVPAGAPPCEGLFLVGSRTASLRPAPLLPLVPTPSEDEVGSERRWNPGSDIAARPSIPAVVALRPDARPPGSRVDRVVSSASVTWRWSTLRSAPGSFSTDESVSRVGVAALA
jgi:hypothetical protein